MIRRNNKPRPVSSLFHYASKYYDPVKAHEYYMRNRELKGRRSARNLNKEGKEVWKIAKSNITAERKVELDKARANHKAVMEKHRANAASKRKDIAKKLKNALRIISDQKRFETRNVTKRTKAQIEKESKDLKRKKEKISSSIERLMSQDFSKLPEPMKSRKIEERRKQVAKLKGDIEKASEKSSDKKDSIREDATSEKDKIRDVVSKAKEGERDTAAAKREKLSADLKGSISRARDAYKAAKESIKAGYETTFQKEFDAIASVYGTDSGKGSSKGYTPTTKTDAERKKIRDRLAAERKKGS